MDFNRIVDEIEGRLTEELHPEDLAKTAKMSLYEFRRIFSFVAGIPLSEYVRRRRLSAAAAELLEGKSVTETALRYGYATPSSFSRAFREFHGIAPSDVPSSGSVRLYTKLSFDLQVRGGTEIPYALRRDETFSLRGYADRSDLCDTECCEKVWTRFYESGAAKVIPAGGRIYASYQNEKDQVLCTIGARCAPDDPEAVLSLPACLWACFPLNRTDDEFVNEYYKTLLWGWLPSSGFSRVKGIPNLEVYPENMETEGFEWEIRIPVERN